uniref:hypothetical protein n=1 Tax=Prevotella sp. TaxID=59823 RepID=UPI004028BCBE
CRFASKIPLNPIDCGFEDLLNNRCVSLFYSFLQAKLMVFCKRAHFFAAVLCIFNAFNLNWLMAFAAISKSFCNFEVQIYCLE